nr:efflux RND transporter permease subunit [Candidatus Dependentiae bacterium]
MFKNEHLTFTDKIIKFCLENKLVVFLLILFFTLWGVIVAPFDWDIKWLNRNPVAVDAIPNIGENQQIVFTDWMGRSPQDVENQITYPLTVSLLGIPGVKTIRSFSMFGFSTVYVIFNEDIEFYWSRTRILEKLNSLPAGILPAGVKPALGPDATPLGQIFWYTLEGRDKNNKPTGGWDLQELRTTQDWFVRYSLQSVQGVSEVASIGGFVKEYQIDIDPDAMHANNVMLEQIYNAVKMSNIDVGGRTIEINKAEYVIRGLGFIKSLEDIEKAVVRVNNNIPIRIKDIAQVSFGPAYRDGVLDKHGNEAVGGVVVVRYGANPLEVIKNVKLKMTEIEKGLPAKTLADGTVSSVKIIPFYDRTGLIQETLGTLKNAISEEIIITIIVILLMVLHLKSSLLISAVLPLAVLMSFIGMKIFGVDANIVSLSGIAIAIGTIVDMGIIICENILRHLEAAPPEEPKIQVVFRAASEVGSALLAAISTTVISFLPVFMMEGAEGKLFKPLAYTKTFALIASVIVALTLIPPLAHVLFTGKIRSRVLKRVFNFCVILLGIIICIKFFWWAGLIIIALSIDNILESYTSNKIKKLLNYIVNYSVIFIVFILLSKHWMPLGPDKGLIKNTAAVILVCISLFVIFYIIQKFYVPILRWCLNNKLLFLSIPIFIILFGMTVWLGFGRIFNFIPWVLTKAGISEIAVETNSAWSFFNHQFPGLGKEFMPSLDEGSYLYMPTTMPHASIGEAADTLKKLNIAIKSIPEIDETVGKIGRVESALDPAPLSMIETVINYKSEYISDKNGERITFKFDKNKNEFLRDSFGDLIQDIEG